MSSGVQLEKATSCGAALSHSKNGKLLPPPMDLFDEYWFFNNTLNLNSKKVSPRPPKTPPQSNKNNDSVACQTPLRSPSTPSPHAHDSENGNIEGDEDDDEVLPVPVSLMRAPSMPAPYSNGFDDAYHKITEHNSDTKPKGSKLRHASSTLGCHHSWHSALEKVPPRPSLTRQHSSMSGRKYCLQHNYRFSDRNYRMFQDKQWRSSSDLESIEVQGFKDLGFVFDKKELKESLSKVIPGLREKEQSPEEKEEKVARPYLSEAWCVESPPAPSIDWKEMKSAAEMKDQLKFWARAVACNVKQEC